MSIQTFFVFSFCCSMREGYPCNWRGFCDYHPGGAKLSQADFFRRILMLRFLAVLFQSRPGGLRRVSPGRGNGFPGVGGGFPRVG